MVGTRAVLFDLGGTLYDYGSIGPGNLDAIAEVAAAVGIGASRQELGKAYREALGRVYREYLPRPYYLHRDLFRDALVAMAAEFGATLEEPHFERYAAARDGARPMVLREGVYDTLAELRRRGLHLGIVSNTDADALKSVAKTARLGEYFDSLLSSEEAGSCKPDQRIFREALRRAGCEPGEALFVGDDRMADVAGANAVGIPSVLLWHRTDRELPDREPRPTHVIRAIPEVLGLVSG